MYEEGLIILYTEDDSKNVYCKNVSLTSSEAKRALDEIEVLQKEGCNIINVEDLSEEELNDLMAKIDSQIYKTYKEQCIPIKVIIKPVDLYSVFNADGSCNVKWLTPADKEEVIKLLQRPNRKITLDRITELENGFMVPMYSYGDFLSVDEVDSICNMDWINIEKDGMILQVGTDDSSLAYSYERSNEEFFRESYEASKLKILNKHQSIVDKIERLNSIKNQVLEVVNINSKKN